MGNIRLNRRFIIGITLVSAMGGLLFGYDYVVIGGAKPFYGALLRYHPIALPAGMGHEQRPDWLPDWSTDIRLPDRSLWPEKAAHRCLLRFLRWPPWGQAAFNSFKPFHRFPVNVRVGYRTGIGLITHVHS